MTIPAAVVVLLAGLPEPGRLEQVFPLVTVDDAGFPHVALLSRAELRADEAEIRAAVASRRSRANLERRGRATLIAVEGTTAHYLKLTATRSLVHDPVLVVAFALAEHKADSLGIPLEPLRFPATDEIATIERWDRSAALLDELERMR